MLLLRTHYLVTDRPKLKPGDCVMDVSVYPDISELFLISDVLVTDYSSSMFDFAVTGRPMVFFTYDLERYRDHVRGFYFGFDAEAPGPLLGTSRRSSRRCATRPRWRPGTGTRAPPSPPGTSARRRPRRRRVLDRVLQPGH